MNQPLYAILISPDRKTRKDILFGKKINTIREGHRDYRTGPVMLCCHIEPWAVMAEITHVRHCKLSEITEEEIRANGHDSMEELLKTLKQFYPRIGPDSPMTIIWWDNISGFWKDKKEYYGSLAAGMTI